MFHPQRCVPSSLRPLNACTQQPKETAITQQSFMYHEPDYMEVLRHLFTSEDELSLDLARITTSFPFLLAQHFAGKVQLVLFGTKQKEVSQMTPFWHSFPIMYQRKEYGMLMVAPDSKQPERPFLPSAVISILKFHCGAMLALFEHRILLQGTTAPVTEERRLFDSLTRRQREVLTLMSQGYEERDIAKRLHISTTTVESHRQNIYVRLGVHTRQDALRVGYQQNLFTPLDAISEESQSQKTWKPSPRKKRRSS